MIKSMSRYGMCLLTCVRILVETKLILDVPQNVTVVGQRFTINCIFTHVPNNTGVIIFKKKGEIFKIVTSVEYVNNTCKGGGYVCVDNCICSTDGRNLSWIIQSLPEAWHDTEWRCGYLNTKSNVYKLNISVPFNEIMISPDKVVVDFGAKMFASCVSFPASRPAAKIIWNKVKKDRRSEIKVNVTEIIYSEDDDKKITNSTFSYIPDKADNGDIIFCTATNVIGENIQSKELEIVVRSVPDENLTLTTKPTINQGDDVHVNCSIKGGNPLVDISLSCGTVKGRNNSYNDTASRQVTLLNISKDFNNVTCSCSATHVARSSFKDQKNITLNVFYPPDVTIISNQEPEENSTSFTLRCVADGNPKQYVYHKWQHFYNGVLVRELNADKILYFFEPLAFQDSGRYFCRVSNAVKDENNNKIQYNSTLVSVKVSPMFITSKQNIIIGEENSSLNIDVEFVAFSRTLNTTWTNFGEKLSDRATTSTVPYPIAIEFYGVDVLVTEYGYKSWLNFTSFQSKDCGNYSLIVTNSIKQERFSFRTKLSGPPNNPRALQFIFVTSKSIDFSWIAGKNNGHNQSFNVTCKGRGIEPKVIRVKGDASKIVYNLSVKNLFPSTVYEVSLFAWNKKGKCPGVLTETITTKESKLYGAYGTSAAAIGGGCLIGMIIAILFGITIYRRKKSHHKDDETEMDNIGVENEEDPDNDVIHFEPAEPYDNPLYAIINAPTGHKQNPQNVSADQRNDDDANENLGAVGGIANEEHGELNETFLRNKNDIPLKATPSRRKNKDGMVYIDVATLGSENSQGKVVIHGIENRNDYAEVDFSRHADPLPSDDDVDDEEDGED